MEKFFRPSKWFVGFCALLILVWGGLQLVANLRLEDEARRAGSDVFSWDWPGRQWRSTAEVSQSSVLKRTATDAIVRVKGRQSVVLSDGGAPGRQIVERDLSATLTFYKSRDQWLLGRVDLP